MGIKREIIKIDEDLCNGCGECVPSCAEGSLQIIDGKAKMIADKYCDGLGACLGHCPQGALSVIVREADPFDEEAVEELLATQKAEQLDAGIIPMAGHASGGGCPGEGMMNLRPAAKPIANDSGTAVLSTLSHWPVQLRLVPPNAPFLKNADLLLTADCVAVSLPDYHARYVPGKVVLMGCPKFDDAPMYVERLAAILRDNEINSVTILQMEVPCCSSMSTILDQARLEAGSGVAVERIIVSRGGQIMVHEKVG